MPTREAGVIRDMEPAWFWSLRWRAHLRCFSGLILLPFKMPVWEPPGWSQQRLCGVLWVSVLYARSSWQHSSCSHPTPSPSPDLVVAPPDNTPAPQQLLWVQYLATRSWNEISLFHMVPKSYRGVLEPLNQVWISYLQGQKFCFSTDPHASCFFPQEIWTLCMIFHKKKGAVGVSAFCFGCRKIWRSYRRAKEGETDGRNEEPCVLLHKGRDPCIGLNSEL